MRWHPLMDLIYIDMCHHESLWHHSKSIKPGSIFLSVDLWMFNFIILISIDDEEREREIFMTVLFLYSSWFFLKEESFDSTKIPDQRKASVALEVNLPETNELVQGKHETIWSISIKFNYLLLIFADVKHKNWLFQRLNWDMKKKVERCL